MSRVEIATDGGRGTVVVDGVDMSGVVSRVTVQASVEQLPVITLELPAVAASLTFDQAVVVVHEQTHDALVALGWTPPS